MTERDHLLRGVLEAPDDDTARLVYADKLDELGGARNTARAAFIRVQIELARAPANIISAGQVVTLDENNRVVPYTTDLGLPPTGIATKNVPNPAIPPLRARGHALLKQWAGAWLPKCLRPGYPGLRVEGATVWVDPLGGYVRFERGFVAEAGCELPTGMDEAVDTDTMTFPLAAERRTAQFAAKVRALLASNPLTGITLSFEGGDEVLYAEITQGRDGESAPHWRVMWDIDTYCQLAHGMIEEPVTVYEWAHVSYVLERWLCRAVREPARAVAMTRELEAFVEIPDDLPGLDLVAAQQQYLNAIMNGLGVPD